MSLIQMAFLKSVTFNFVFIGSQVIGFFLHIGFNQASHFLVNITAAEEEDPERCY